MTEDLKMENPETAQRIDEFLNDPSTGVTRERGARRTPEDMISMDVAEKCLMCDSTALTYSDVRSYVSHPANGGHAGWAFEMGCQACKFEWELRVERRCDGVFIFPVCY